MIVTGAPRASRYFGRNFFQRFSPRLMRNIASETAMRLPCPTTRGFTSSLSDETTVAIIRNIRYTGFGRHVTSTAPELRPTTTAGPRWLLLAHQLPTRPSHTRVKTWRRLQQIGAVPTRNSVYALPNTLQCREDFEWIRSE